MAANKMKGIYSKGFKCISQIFDVKDREMEIGYPTDVKHVAHIGFDGASCSKPTWMNDYKAGADLSSPRPSFVNQRHSNSFDLSLGSSQDFDQAMGQQPMKDMFRDMASTTARNLPNIPKHQKGKKKSSSSSSASFSSASSRSKSSYKSAAGILS